MRLPTLSALLAISATAFAQRPSVTVDEDYLNKPVQREILPSGPELMAEVVERLPRERREIFARLVTRREDGPDRECRAESVLQFGAQPATATYLLLDGLGGSLEKLQITWTDQGATRYQFFAGPDLEPEPAFVPTRAVNGLDFNWSDLSLSFLWWPGAHVRGTDQAKLRKCYVVDIPAPPADREAGTSIRLWIDAKEKLLMKAAVLDENDKPLRTIEVDSIKKINDIWMVKDLDIENLRTGSRTRVRVEDIR